RYINHSSRSAAMSHFWSAAASVLLVVGSASAGDGVVAAAKPNVVLIVADDLGSGELGCYGQKLIRTPNVDKLAAGGMTFTRFYAGNAVCAPSRCALLTGKHMGHATVRDTRAVGADGQWPIKADDAT